MACSTPFGFCEVPVTLDAGLQGWPVHKLVCDHMNGCPGGDPFLTQMSLKCSWLPLASGDGTLYLDTCPHMSFFLYTGMLSPPRAVTGSGMP